MSAPRIVLQALRIRVATSEVPSDATADRFGPEVVDPFGPGATPGAATPGLLFHLHHERLAGAPSSSADEEGPRWDGGAQLAFATRNALAAWLAPRRPRAEPTGGGATRRVVTTLCEEHVVRESETPLDDPVVLVRHHWRHPALSRASFRETWRGSHAALVEELPAATRIRRYVQLHNVGDPGDPLYDAAGDVVDGTSLWSFASLEELETLLAGSDYREIAADERDFCATTEFFTARSRVLCDPSGVARPG